MSKRENHWYLLGATIQAFGKLRRPGAWQVGLWLALIAMFAIGFQTGVLDKIFQYSNSPAFLPVLTAFVVAVSFGARILLGRWRLTRARSSYVKALQLPSPERLIELVTQSMKNARALPDTDALGAQSRAIAYALYGRENEAIRALAEVDWKSKAPLIRAGGLSAEVFIELLCRHNVQRALELTRKAQTMSSVSTVLPGAAQSKRASSTYVAVGEALLKIESPAGLRRLEESAADSRFPPLQLLASFGLAAAMDRSGNNERANQLRGFIRQVAPHCAPLHLKAEEFSVPDRDRAEVQQGPVSSSLSSTNTTGGEAVQERSAKRKLIRTAGIVVGLWVLLIVMFVATWTFFAPPK